MSVVLQAVEPDSLRAALHAVFSRREYRWSEPSSAWVWLTERWQRLFEWLEALRLAHPARYYVVLGALTLVLVALLAHLGYVVWRSLRPGETARASLPDAVPVRGPAWHRAEALRLGRAGRFADALAHRFLAVVLELDARRVLRFHPSKTPAEYAAEARLDDAGRSALAGLVTSLYHHLFGGVPCDADEWHRFDARAAELGLHAAAR